MMNKLTLMDIKSSIWNKDFRDLFPEYKEVLEKFLKDPGCACNVGILKDLMRHKDRMQKYFPNKECLTPEEEDKEIIGKNDWGVINCHIDQIEDRLRKLQQGKRLVAAARFKDRVTIITNDVAAYHVPSKTAEEHIKESKEAKMNWKVINTTINELLHELRKFPNGRKMVTVTRFQDKITAIVNDMEALF